MGVIGANEETRKRLEQMTREKWDKTCLQNRVRLAGVAKKFAQNDDIDHMERLGVTDDEIEELREAYNGQRRKEQRVVKEDAVKTVKVTNKNLELKEQMRKYEEEAESLRSQARKSERKISQLRKDRDSHSLRIAKLESEISQLREERKSDALKISKLEHENKLIRELIDDLKSQAPQKIVNILEEIIKERFLSTNNFS